MKLKFIFFLEHSFASLFMISPEASGLNHDDFIVFLFWRKIKKIVGMISVNIQISQKNQLVFIYIIRSTFNAFSIFVADENEISF